MAGSALKVALLGNQGSVHVQRWIEGLRDRGHEVHGIDLSGHGRSPAARIAAYVRLRRDLLEATRAGAVVALHYVPDGALASGLRGIHPLVASVWGDDVSREPAKMRQRIARMQQRALLTHADARTATSRYLQAILTNAYALDSIVVPFGVDTSVFAPTARPPGRRVRLAYVKWLESKYGPDVLIEALALVRPDVDVELSVAGDGPLRAQLEVLARTRGLGDRVTFLGRLAHGSVGPLLASSDILVMPSRWEEFGVSAAEASATALPVIATRVGGIPEVVEDGVTGVLVAPDDPAALAQAIERLAADPQLRSRMGAAGRARVQERFEWRDCVVRMETVYREVTSRPRR